MSSYKESDLTTPYNTIDKVLELNITDNSVYKLNDIIKVPSTYTFSIWYKAKNESMVSFDILGNKEQVSSNINWQKYIETVTIDQITDENNYISIGLDPNNVGYFYEAYLSEGELNVAWTPAPEDVEEEFYEVRSEIKQTAERIDLTVEDIKGNISNINIQIGKIEQSVKDNEGNISSLATTVDGIKGTVEKQGESISNIDQKADKISQDVTNVRNDLNSKITQTAEQINQKVDDVKSELSSDITQTAGQISQEVTDVRNDLTSKITQTEKRISQEIKDVNDNLSSRIDQTAGSITSTVKSEIDKIAIGGRNLLFDSNVEVTNSDYNIAQYTMSEKMIVEETYSCTLWGKLGAGKEKFGLWLDGGSINIAYLKDNGDGTYSATFTGKAGTSDQSTIHVYVVASSVTVESTITKIKLEKGTKATDWTPAPEDVEEDIDNAQSAADDAKDKADSTEERVTASESKIEQLSDSISTMVTDKNGNSLMTQTGNGWTFNMGAIEDTLDDAKQTLKDLEGDMGVVDSTLSQLESLTNDLGKKTAYINMTTDDSGSPCLELGKSDSAFKVRISNTSVDFIEGSVRIAYISNRALYIERAIIKNEFQIGDNGGFIFRKRSSGNMGIRWVGGVD